MQREVQYQEPTLLGTHDAISGHSRSWFVYLLALTDCSGFKVGFSCNPLQRVHTFSRRYFERFDLHGSLLLELETEADARAAEAALKTDLAACRVDAPSWVPLEAGGHTEWFSAVHFGSAEERLRSFLQLHEAARIGSAADYVRSELERFGPNFESWAWGMVQHVADGRWAPNGMHLPPDVARSLRDWLDAYLACDVALFVDDPQVLKFVKQCARPLAVSPA